MGKTLLFGVLGVSILVYGCHDVMVEMSDGEKLYRAKCSSCHKIIAPSRFNRDIWLRYIEKFGGKMTDEERLVVLQYLEDSG
jgi:hypothetical protein